MIEIKNEAFSFSRSTNTKFMLNSQYNVRADKLGKDLELLKSKVDEEGIGYDDHHALREAVWILGKWASKDIVTIKLAFNELGVLEHSSDEVLALGIKYLKAKTLLSEAKRLDARTALMNCKYLETQGKLVIIDLSKVLDALAFEYNFADEGISNHTLDVWTRNATLFTINDGNIITDMIRGETGELADGELTDIIRQCRINTLCPKIKLGNEWIVSYLGNKKRIGDKGRDKYEQVIDLCNDELIACIVGKISSAGGMGHKVKLLGTTNNCELAFDYLGDNISELFEQFSVIVKVFMKRYIFEPTIYLYNSENDKLELVRRQ